LLPCSARGVGPHGLERAAASPQGIGTRLGYGHLDLAEVRDRHDGHGSVQRRRHRRGADAEPADRGDARKIADESIQPPDPRRRARIDVLHASMAAKWDRLGTRMPVACTAVSFIAFHRGRRVEGRVETERVVLGELGPRGTAMVGRRRLSQRRDASSHPDWVPRRYDRTDTIDRGQEGEQLLGTGYGPASGFDGPVSSGVRPGAPGRR